MIDYIIQMAITTILVVCKEKDAKVLSKLKPALLKVRNAINLCYPGE